MSPQGAAGESKNDWSLLARIGQKDEDALSALYDRHSGLVFSEAKRILRDTGAAEEILQDLFYQVWRTAERFDPAKGSLAGWLLVAARNRAISKLRRKSGKDGEHIRPEELELLAPGALPPEEQAALQDHLSGCAECAAKLAQARGRASILAFAVNQDRPAGTVKAELMARIRVSREADQHYAWPSKVEAQRKAKDQPNRNPDMGSRWWNWALVSAAVALAVISFALSWQNRRITAELRKERKAAESLIQDREQIEKLVGVLAAPDTVTVKLAPTEPGATASGLVKFNAKAGIVLYEADLPKLPAGKSYQMWLVPANGAPISAGLLGPGGRPWGNMWTGDVPADTQAKAFAITIEPVGGTPQPTGPKVLLGAA
ncbi:MAG: sigma-70 family RNA polymerase sigma factor [Candidatus Acidiferrum sp.]